MQTTGHTQEQENQIRLSETTMRLYEYDGKRKVGRREGQACGPKHNTPWLKHGKKQYYGISMQTGNGSGSLVWCTGNVTAHIRRKTNSGKHRAILCPYIYPNVTKLCFTMQMDN